MAFSEQPAANMMTSEQLKQMKNENQSEKKIKALKSELEKLNDKVIRRIENREQRIEYTEYYTKNMNGSTYLPYH